MARIGYARVSTIEQDLDGQLSRLRAEGCAIVRSEKVSGASREGRTELATVLEFLRAGDELVVTRLDRLGRDTRDVLNVVHEAEQRGASVTVLDPHVSTRGTAFAVGDPQHPGPIGLCAPVAKRHSGRDASVDRLFGNREAQAAGSGFKLG